MAIIQFPKYLNFYLVDSHWGRATTPEVVGVLKSCIDALYFSQDRKLIPNITVTIDHVNYDPQSVGKANPTPMWYPGDLIYLVCADEYWSQYIFQFSHELCHHNIGKSPLIADNFGWLEEGLCQMASLFVLKRLYHNWSTNPPLPQMKGDYINHKIYLDDHFLKNPTYSLQMPFKDWLQASLPTLYTDRYIINSNIIIGINLLPVFLNKPSLWECVQYYKKVDCHANGITTLGAFLTEWEKVLPKYLKKRFQDIKNVLD